MKQVYLLLILGVIGLNLQAQTYYPMPTQDATWNFEYYVFANLPFSNAECIMRHYGLAGDTVINNKTYHKLYGNNLPQDYPYFDTQFNLPTAHYVGAYREDSTKKVWMYMANDSLERLYYDFALNANDSFYFDPALHSGGGGAHYVIYTDSILINGSYRKQWHFSNGGGEIWIEGIGSLSGWFEWNYVACGFALNLRCMDVSQNQIYNTGACHCDTYTPLQKVAANESEIKLYPNPASNFLTIDTKIAVTDVEIYNNLGQLVLRESFESVIDLTELATGLYAVRLLNEGTVVGLRQFAKL